MSLQAAVWLIIFLALLMANLPFAVNRPLAAWPWQNSKQPALLNWLLGLIYLLGVAIWSWGTLNLIGGAISTSSSWLMLLISALIAAAWLYWPGLIFKPVANPPGTRASQRKDPKPFINRLLEVMITYVLVGTMGFALELNMGNAFPTQWEFFAVSMALFLVMAYPGFVVRYMLKKRRR